MKKYQTFKKGVLLAAGVLAVQFALVPIAQAQPDPNNAPKGENPPERQRPNRERMAQARAQAEQGMRHMMVQGGITDEATQNAILAYIREDLEARRPVREQGMRLRQAMRGDAVTDEQLSSLITDYRAAQEAEAVRREEAQDALDAKIGFSRNPRLEAMLLLSGVIGDGSGMMFMHNRRRGGRGPRGEGDGNQQERQQRMLERFDANKDGKLDGEEEAAMRKWMQERREERPKEADEE